MFRKPSLKTLQKAFGEELGKKLRTAMDAAKDSDEALNKSDELIGGHGVEYIPEGHNQKSPAITYVNMGDPYSTTILEINGNVKVGNWGSYAEYGDYD